MRSHKIYTGDDNTEPYFREHQSCCSGIKSGKTSVFFWVIVLFIVILTVCAL
jgi:hypothetical protein